MHFVVIFNWYRSIASIQFKLDTKIKMKYSKIKSFTFYSTSQIVVGYYLRYNRSTIDEMAQIVLGLTLHVDLDSSFFCIHLTT